MERELDGTAGFSRSIGSWVGASNLARRLAILLTRSAPNGHTCSHCRPAERSRSYVAQGRSAFGASARRASKISRFLRQGVPWAGAFWRSEPQCCRSSMGRIGVSPTAGVRAVAHPVAAERATVRNAMRRLQPLASAHPHSTRVAVAAPTHRAPCERAKDCSYACTLWRFCAAQLRRVQQASAPTRSPPRANTAACQFAPAAQPRHILR